MLAPPWLPIPPEGYGGIENVLKGLIPNLIKLGVDVEVFATGDTTIESSKLHWLYPTGQYEEIHNPIFLGSPVIVAHLLFALNAIEKDGNFDVIHDHNGFFGPLAVEFAGKNLPPVIHTIHGPPFDTTNAHRGAIPSNLPMWRQFTGNKQLYFVGISEALMKSAPAEMRTRTLKPVHNAIDVEDFPLVTKKEDYYITLSRFNADKGHPLAMKVCEELGLRLKMAGVVCDMTTNKQVMLELANPQSNYRSNEDFRYFSDKVFPHLLSGSIEYVGEVSGKNKIAFVSKAKALLFPIDWEEPFGMAPIEALACGTPVVAMARGALPEIIEHGVNGFLAHTPSQFKSFVKRIGEINPADCRLSVERHFSADVMAKEYLKRYRTVIARTS